MNLTLVTLFPEVFKPILKSSILKKASDKNLLKTKFINPRDFAKDKHKTVDDKPYGGGAGMVLKVDVLTAALRSIKPKPYIILLSASGKKYDQKIARKLSNKQNLALVCGHYEGIDARVEKYADEVLSVGDFVLTGGEIPAMAVMDSVIRLIPGLLNPNSPLDESFEKSLLEYPQYTRPEDFEGQKVPKVLLSGNHRQIELWREKEAFKRTKKNRPDLFKLEKK